MQIQDKFNISWITEMLNLPSFSIRTNGGTVLVRSVGRLRVPDCLYHSSISSTVQQYLEIALFWPGTLALGLAMFEERTVQCGGIEQQKLKLKFLPAMYCTEGPHKIEVLFFFPFPNSLSFLRAPFYGLQTIVHPPPSTLYQKRNIYPFGPLSYFINSRTLMSWRSSWFRHFVSKREWDEVRSNPINDGSHSNLPFSESCYWLPPQFM